MNTKAKPEISIIGAGSVGITMAHALISNGYKINAISSMSMERAKIIAEQLSTPLTDSYNAANSCDLLLLTVSDNAIKEVSSEIASSGKLTNRPIVIHFSGAMSSHELAPLKELGCPIASMHPLQTFPKNVITDINDTRWFIEGDQEAIVTARSLAENTGGIVHIIQTESKPIYHAASVFCSNYIVSVIDAGLDLFESAGIDRDDALKAASPLIRASIENTLKTNPQQALTGPIARGDFSTIHSHVESISKSQNELTNLYREIAKKTIELAKKKNTLNPEAEKQIRILLEE